MLAFGLRCKCPSEPQQILSKAISTNSISGMARGVADGLPGEGMARILIGDAQGRQFEGVYWSRQAELGTKLGDVANSEGYCLFVFGLFLREQRMVS